MLEGLDRLRVVELEAMSAKLRAEVESLNPRTDRDTFDRRFFELAQVDGELRRRSAEG